MVQDRGDAADVVDVAAPAVGAALAEVLLAARLDVLEHLEKDRAVGQLVLVARDELPVRRALALGPLAAGVVHDPAVTGATQNVPVEPARAARQAPGLLLPRAEDETAEPVAVATLTVAARQARVTAADLAGPFCGKAVGLGPVRHVFGAFAATLRV